MVDLPASPGYSGGRTFVVDIPGPVARRSGRAPPARARLHRLPVLVRQHGRAQPDTPRGHLRPALARPRDPFATVPFRRLRRRRRSSPRRPGDRRGSRGRLLDGRRGRTGALAPTPGSSQRPGAGLDGAQLPRPHPGEVLLLADDPGHAPDSSGSPSPGSSGWRWVCPRSRRTTPGTASAGAPASSAAPARGRCRRCSGSSGGSTPAPWIGEVDVPDGGRRHRRRQGDPRARASGRWRPRSPGPRCCEAPGGHASVVLDHANWFPVFLEAVQRRHGRGSRSHPGVRWVSERVAPDQSSVSGPSESMLKSEFLRLIVSVRSSGLIASMSGSMSIP